MKTLNVLAAALLLLPALGARTASAAPAEIQRGRYVVRMGGCNDCHTAGYSETNGALPESQWLTGVPVGYKGPWGVTYPANLRLLAQQLTEDEWNTRIQLERRPPMPWFTLRAMSDADRRAMYRFIRSLGPAGAMAPDYVAPGAPVKTPFILFVPQSQGTASAAPQSPTPSATPKAPTPTAASPAAKAARLPPATAKASHSPATAVVVVTAKRPVGRLADVLQLERSSHD